MAKELQEWFGASTSGPFPLDPNPFSCNPVTFGQLAYVLMAAVIRLLTASLSVTATLSVTAVKLVIML